MKVQLKRETNMSNFFSRARGLQIVFNGPLLNCFICCSKPEQQKVQLHPIAVSHSWKCRKKNIHFIFVFSEYQEKTVL